MHKGQADGLNNGLAMILVGLAHGLEKVCSVWPIVVKVCLVWPRVTKVSKSVRSGQYLSLGMVGLANACLRSWTSS